MIQYDAKTRTQKDNQQIEIITEMYEILRSKINECLSNEKFKELPIKIIYRILEKSSPDKINSNILFDIIIKSLNQFCVLFAFVELQKLSEDRLSELCEIYSKTNENERHYFDYLKCNLNLIKEMNNRKKNLEETNEGYLNKMSELETKISSLQNQFNETEKINEQLQEKYSNSEKANNRLQNELNDSKNLNNNQQNKIKDLENQISQLQNKLANSEKQLNERFIIKGNETFPTQSVDPNERLILFNGNSFNGIIHNLTNECGGNVHDKGKVLVSASSVNQENALPKFAADIDNLNSFFISKNEPNSWLEYDFIELKVRPTHYSIRSYPCARNCFHPKSWVIEGSNEKKNWVILDSQNDVDYLNNVSAFHTFEIQKLQKSNDYFRYLRFRQTGLNAGSINHFNFSALEFFGGIK